MFMDDSKHSLYPWVRVRIRNRRKKREKKKRIYTAHELKLVRNNEFLLW